MPISRPTTKTIISTTGWGIPITDEVNRLTPQSDSNVTRIAALETATAKTAWTNLTLINGWVQYAGGRANCSYRKVGDIVYLRFAAHSGTGSQPMAVLPVGFRPSTVCDFIGRDSSTAGAGVFNVNTDGNIIYYGVGNALCALNCSFSTI